MWRVRWALVRKRKRPERGGLERQAEQSPFKEEEGSHCREERQGGEGKEERVRCEAGVHEVAREF